MRIKEADDKQPLIDALAALLTRPGLPAATRREIEHEIRAVRAGAQGERDAAYEIEFRYADARNVATIHDLRIECGARVAQIDHLIINRLLEVWVCESKHFAEGVAISERGEWERFVGRRRIGMASPLEQNRKHIAVLEEVVRSGMVRLPRRPYAIHPEFHSLVLVSNGARIVRPRRRVEGLECVIKCDQLGSTIDRQIDDRGYGLLSKAALRLIGQEALATFARELAALHRPAPLDHWAARFGLPDAPPVAAVASVAEPVPPIPEPPLADEALAAAPSDLPPPSVAHASAQSPERLLADLNAAQREAVLSASGPLAIIAGAGSGKTRVVSRRAAFAIETGVVPEDQVLLVTFTEKAAREMVERMAALGHRRVMARTFHAAALAQLRHFWPSRHDGDPLPAVLPSKLELLVPLARRLPGGYRFTPAKDLADAIEWAKVRRIPPERWVEGGGTRAPLPPELFARLYRDYERAKARAGRLDFEDMLVRTVELLESDTDAAAVVRIRKRWFMVDEYQDTNPLAERLLELWLGESRDLAVVGDPDQTIYTFAGASPEFLLRFAERHPGARTVALTENYRSSPQVLALANRLIATSGRGPLRATQPAGPVPVIRRHADGEAELAAFVAGIREVLAAGVPPAEIAVLVRLNAQLPEVEEALTRAGIGFRVTGQRFFERDEVRQARRLLARAKLAETGPALAAALRQLLADRLGLAELSDEAGEEARQRVAGLELLLGIVTDLAAKDADLRLADVLAELERRDTAEAQAVQDGVNLLTYHRAKGLEWEAVFLPSLEEGLLPVRQAKDEAAVAEERRLLYVGVTRARRHLALSWAARRTGPAGKAGARQASRFLAGLAPRREPPASRSASPGPAAAATPDGALLDRLRAWRRERARHDGVPAYVVAEDATLAAIAGARPQTLDELRDVRGIGPARLERYGAEVLALFKDGHDLPSPHVRQVKDGR
ncbi:MAG: UvrD-helicase domain-containing protein [Chloroflexi bacterium]|nr:UvrD-helicase domain-containing protein [Chloroflexota bacterium]